MRDIQVGRYLFVRRLGEGGSAPVWEAKETQVLKRTVAIKLFLVPRSDSAALGSAIQKLQQDMVPMESIKDLPVVTPLGYELVDGYLAGDNGFYASTDDFEGDAKQDVTLIMAIIEYVDGGDISTRYRDQVVQNDTMTFLRHFSDLVSGLREIHTRSIYHRDIKPANLFWSRKGDEIKFGDWGIAKAVDLVDAYQSAIIGSLPYMSPESFREGAEATPERDIYALGCTLYELYTGELAFLPDPLPQQSRQMIDAFRDLHKNADPPMAVGKTGKVGISYEFSVLIRDMMSPKPSDRPSAEAILKAIEREIDRLEVPVPDMGSLDLTQRMPRKPFCVTEFSLNPAFRRQAMNEVPVFLCFDLAARNKEQVDLLYSIFRHFYDDSFTLLETFGRYEFIAKIWADSRGERLKSLIKALTKMVVADERLLRIFAAADVVHPANRYAFYDQTADPAEMLAAVHDVQLDGRDPKAKQQQWRKLLRKKFVYGKYKNPFGVDHVPGYCFIHIAGQDATIDGLKTESGNIADAINECFRHRTDVVESVVIYRRETGLSFGKSKGLADIVVEFTSPDYESVVQLPEIIMQKLSHERIQTDTMIATKRYGIISDWPRALGLAAVSSEFSAVSEDPVQLDIVYDSDDEHMSGFKDEVTGLAAKYQLLVESD